jgi:TPP-dependent indolepyruvate ferredoxin oxidoreductase alpha subunit/Pyruvate/2-oxoacid:ferredoxin oxidoreductase gamma subunit
MATDPRFLAESGHEVFTGNELLVKGALETDGGVHLLTGYPGSPVAGFFDVLGDISGLLTSKGIRAFQANNEALSIAAVNGSQMAPTRAIAAFKSVGVHVASDALALGNLGGAHPQGGALIVMGDDPWCDSTQVPADSRFICEHLRMPVVEPGTPQELKDWVGLGLKLSQSAGMYIGYIVTVAHADGGGTVLCKPNQFPAINTQQKIALETKQIDLGKVLLPPRTWQRELLYPERFAKTMAAARELGINKIIGASRDVWGSTGDASSNASSSKPPLGFIITGMGGPYLQHVLADLGLSGVFPILQMGMSYPADVQLVKEFSGTCQKMIVIEERRSFLEKNIRDAIFHALPQDQAVDIASRLFGKTFPGGGEGISELRGLNFSVLAQKLIPLFQATLEIPPAMRNGRLSSEMDRLRKVSRPKLAIFNEKVVSRTPTFCPGCPHRDSSAALLEMRRNLADPKYMSRHHGIGPIDLVAHGDTGCYTMLMFAPTEQLMHNYSGMGLGGGTGSGIDPFITNKQIVFMGDGTFFHSGQVAISNSIKTNQDITYIILENKTTAMTGHQEHAGTEMDVLGNRSYIQDIEEIIRGMAGTSPLTVVKLSPANREKYKSVLERTILSDGVKVVIADKECGITHQRTVLKEERKIIKKHGYLPRKTHMNVTPEVCENCLECTKATACPGLASIETDYGKKIDTDLTWCVNDGACERVRVSNELADSAKPCPSFEQVTVVRSKRRRYMLPNLDLAKLPDPQRVHDMSAANSTWRVHMSGVGGMGIGVVGAILVRAGHKEGYRVIFQDKKGLAIRNGGVFAQITFVSDKSMPEKPARISRDASGDSVAGLSAAGITSAGVSLAGVSTTGAGYGAGSNGSSNDDATVGSTASSATAASTPTEPAASLITGSIPYGKADLLLGIDILEAARAIDPREAFRVASPQHTTAVLNLHKQATVFNLLGKDDFDPEALRDEIYQQCNPEHSFAKNLAEICERRLGSKQFVNIMMLGVAYQLGLIPVSARSIAWAIKDTIRRHHRRNLKAFNIGRKLALEPRALPVQPQPENWQHLVTNKSRILRKAYRKGAAIADRFEKLTQSAIQEMPDLPEKAKYDLALRIYDLMQYQDAGLARRYAQAVHAMYVRDNASRGYEATIAVIWNLAKVTLIKDEPYVAHLLTRYEKKQRDIVKYNVDVANGDRLVYRHHTSPEFNLGRMRIRMKITTSDWQLKIVRHMKWWRKLPGWHRRETAFRDWYIALLDRVNLASEGGYAQALVALRSPEEVTGYREVRYPKMDRAREMVEKELGVLPTIAMKAMKPTGTQMPAAV